MCAQDVGRCCIDGDGTMSRIVFVISGNNVQGVGYRLFLLRAMKERNVVGFPVNLGSGKQINIIAWGLKKNINDFYNYAGREKPSEVGVIQIGSKIIDEKPKPQPSNILNEKMDLMIDQTGRFVEEGKTITKTLRGMHKTLKNINVSVKTIPVCSYKRGEVI